MKPKYDWRLPHKSTEGLSWEEYCQLSPRQREVMYQRACDRFSRVVLIIILLSILTGLGLLAWVWVTYP